MKWLTIIILVMLLFPSLVTAVDLEYSTDNSTWKNVTIIDYSQKEGTVLDLHGNTLYYFRGRINETTDWYYLSQRTEADTEGSMAVLAITLFILAIAGSILYMALKVDFTSKPFTNRVIKRGMITIFAYLMMWNSSIMATIAEFVGINLNQEMFRYMWIFGMAGYVLAGYMVLITLLDVLKMYKIKKNNKRMGKEDDEE